MLSNGTPEYIFAWGASNSMLTLELATKRHTEARDIISGEADYFTVVCKNRISTAYYRKDEIAYAREYIGPELLKKDVVDNYFDGCRNIEREFLKLVDEMNNCNLKLISSHELVNFIDHYSNILIRIFAYYRLTTGQEYMEALETAIRAIVEDEDEFDILLRPPQTTEAEDQEVELLKLAEKEKIQNKEIMEYISAFPQIAYNTYHEASIIHFVKEKLRIVKVKNAEERQFMMQELTDRTMLIEKQNALYKKYNANSELKQYTQTMQDFSYWRFRQKKCWAGAEFVFRWVFREIAARIDVDFETMMWVYTTNDMKLGLLEHVKLDEEEIQNRKELYVLNVFSGVFELLVGERARDFCERHINIISDQRELCGSVAMRGSAKGRVRMVHVGDLALYNKEAALFQEGDVLVTTMTQVHVVPLMKKAGAILTEQGGVTSHAAVVARELGKPCLVGVEHLMTVLKDGDMIEVDADNGVVRKI